MKFFLQKVMEMETVIHVGLMVTETVTPMATVTPTATEMVMATAMVTPMVTETVMVTPMVAETATVTPMVTAMEMETAILTDCNEITILSHRTTTKLRDLNICLDL